MQHHHRRPGTPILSRRIYRFNYYFTFCLKAHGLPRCFFLTTAQAAITRTRRSFTDVVTPHRSFRSAGLHAFGRCIESLTSSYGRAIGTGHAYSSAFYAIANGHRRSRSRGADNIAAASRHATSEPRERHARWYFRAGHTARHQSRAHISPQRPPLPRAVSAGWRISRYTRRVTFSFIGRQRTRRRSRFHCRDLASISR